MSSKTSIIILNWNGLQDTLECLASLKNVTHANYEVIVVDNNSSGNDVEVIEEKYGDFIQKVIINEKNLGFSGGNNIGIKNALQDNPDYILLLNNDTVVEPDFLTKMIEESGNEKPGIITPMITYFDDKEKIWSAGGSISKIKASGFTFGHNDYFKNHIYNKYCTFASGCCMLVKREVIEKVGLLDEDYFLYLEDTDYCQRVVDAGYKLLYVGSSRIYHKVFSTTARESNLLPLYYSIRNRLYFAKKNFGLYSYLSMAYLATVFITKLIFVLESKKEVWKIIKQSFKDYFNNNMGRTDIFDVR